MSSMINQAALATAVVNIVGNTQGLERAIGESQKQMRGFMVFAQAMGGRTGGMLANMFSAGGASPFLSAVLGSRVGGGLSTFLQNKGLLKNPIQDIDAAMDQARQRFENERYRHKVRGMTLSIGGQYDGETIQDQFDLKVARLKHARKAPKLATFMEEELRGVAEEAQKQALWFGKLGLVTGLSIAAIRKLTESGAELDRQFRKANNVFGSTLQHAVGGYGGFGSNMSRSQYLAGAAGIGQQLAANGVGNGQSSVMTASLARGSGRLAQMWGAEFEDVAGKVASALGGSDKALQEFGITLDENIVRANAFNKGMIKLHETMTGAVAAQSRYELIIAQIEKSTRDMGSGFFNLDHQWDVFKANIVSGLELIGSLLSPVASGLLAVANGLGTLLGSIVDFTGSTLKSMYDWWRQASGNFGMPEEMGPPDPGRQALLSRAGQDAARAEEILRRERGRQSSNVGYHSAAGFYQHIQRGIYGDPTEFAKRTADLMAQLVVVSKEQLDALRDFGYKPIDATGLLQP